MPSEPEHTKTVFEVLQEPLEQALREAPPQGSDPQETLDWRTFVRVVVYYFLAGLSSGRRLLTELRHAEPELQLPRDLKKSTFFDAFQRFDPHKAQQLFYGLLQKLPLWPIAEMATLGVLCAVDGSHWPGLYCMKWACVGSQKPTVLLHLALGLNQMVPVAMLLGHEESSERDALRAMRQRGVTDIADRGYFAYQLLYDLQQAGAFFVIRAVETVRYKILETLPVELPAAVRGLSPVQDLKVYCGKDGNQSVWRLVRFEVAGSTFLLFTNRWDLTTWQVMTCYAYRWQVELLFRFLKRTLSGLHLLSHSPDGLRIQFHLMLVTALLLVGFKQRTAEAAARARQQALPIATTGLQDRPHPRTRPTTATGWFQGLGQRLKQGWRIGCHWLHVLRRYLAKPWDPAVFELLPGAT